MSVYLGTEKISVYTGGVTVKNSGQYVWEKYEVAPNPYLSFIGNEDFTLNVYGGSKGWDGTIEYSTDALTWNTWEDSATISSYNNVLYLRGIGNTKMSANSMPVYSFKFTGTDTLKIACEGNIENLLDYETVSAGGHPTMAEYCYNNLFGNCKYLTIAPELPATKLSNYCYQNMFKGCTSLTIAPELPATVMYNSCYSNMFKNCTLLTTIPSLPATDLVNSYTSMFNGCTNIKLSTEQIGEYQTPYRIPTSGTGVERGTNSLTDMFANTGGTFVGTPEINTTYYLSTSNTVV